VAGVVLGLALGALVGLAVAVVVCAVLTLLVARGTRTYPFRVLGAQPASESDYPALHNLLEGLCATFGLRPPRLMVVEDEIPNACAFGPEGRATVVVTTGLVRRLDLIEMEGVMGHELAHVKRHDAAVSAAAITALAPLVFLTGSDQLVHWAVGRGREYFADRLAAALVRYPPGLHDALASMEAAPAPNPESVFSGRRFALTRWTWIDPMVARRDVSLVGDLDATPVRIAALGEL